MHGCDAGGRSCFDLARQGTDEAFAALRARHEREIYRYVLKSVRNFEDAEDVAQEFWLKVARSSEQAEDRDHFHGWLFRVARNTAVDFVRSRQRRPVTEQVESVREVDLADRHAVNPEDHAVEGDDGGATTWRAINALPDRYRVALVLRALRGLSNQELGEQLGISRGAAEVLTSRARKRLAKLLAMPEAAPATCTVSLWYIYARLDGGTGQRSYARLHRHSASCSACAEWLDVIGYVDGERRAHG